MQNFDSLITIKACDHGNRLTSIQLIPAVLTLTVLTLVTLSPHLSSCLPALSSNWAVPVSQSDDQI